MKRKVGSRRYGISHHAEVRFSERTSVKNKDFINNANNAFKNGFKANHFSGEFYDFLSSKSLDNGRATVRVYQGYIYVFDNHNGILVTVYEVPEKFKGEVEGLSGAGGESGLSGGPCIVIVRRGAERLYVAECDELVSDIALAIEFKTEQRAKNYIKNNANLSGEDIVIMGL